MNETQLSCPSCGAASPPDAQFCRECGAILVRGGSAPRPPPLVPGERPPAPPAGAGPPPPQKKQDPKPWIAIVVAILILGGITAYFFRKREPSEIPVPGEAPSAAPTEAPPTEAPTTRPEPTRSRPPLAPAPKPPQDFHEPPLVPTPRLGREPAPPPERAPEPQPTAPAARRPPRNEAPRGETEPTIGGGVTQRAGWYRVKFRAPLFAQPSETSPVITYLRPGTRIRVTHTVPGFLAVESTTGKAPGWVSTDDAVPEGVDVR